MCPATAATARSTSRLPRCARRSAATALTRPTTPDCGPTSASSSGATAPTSRQGAPPRTAFASSSPLLHHAAPRGVRHALLVCAAGAGPRPVSLPARRWACRAHKRPSQPVALRRVRGGVLPQDYGRTTPGFGIAAILLAPPERSDLATRFLRGFSHAGEASIPIDMSESPPLGLSLFVTLSLARPAGGSPGVCRWVAVQLSMCFASPPVVVRSCSVPAEPGLPGAVWAPEAAGAAPAARPLGACVRAAQLSAAPRRACRCRCLARLPAAHA